MISLWLCLSQYYKDNRECRMEKHSRGVKVCKPLEEQIQCQVEEGEGEVCQDFKVLTLTLFRVGTPILAPRKSFKNLEEKYFQKNSEFL